MTEIYGEQHRAIQDIFGTKNLADRVNEIIVATEIADDRKGFIESRDLFTSSYKGGNSGFVRVLDSKRGRFRASMATACSSRWAI